MSFISIFNWLDGVIILILVFFTLAGLKQGFIDGLMSLIIWLVAITLAYFLTDSFEQVFSNWVTHNKARYVLTFLLIMLFVWLVSKCLLFIITLIGSSDNEANVFNNLLGGALGLVKGSVLMTIVLLMLNLNHTVKAQSFWQDSYMVNKMIHYGSGIYNSMPEHIKNQIKQKRQQAENALKSQKH